MTVSTLLEILAPAPLGATWFLVVVSTLLEILGHKKKRTWKRSANTAAVSTLLEILAGFHRARGQILLQRVSTLLEILVNPEGLWVCAECGTVMFQPFLRF